MRSAAVLVVVIGLAACAAPPQEASSPQCDAFARSGGYPILSGGPTLGQNQALLQLPGMKPLMIGPFDDGHLVEEAYLREWCLRNLQ